MGANEGNVSKTKRGLLKNPGTDFGGGFNTKSGTRSADTPKEDGYGKWQGKTKGGITHTYKGE